MAKRSRRHRGRPPKELRGGPIYQAQFGQGESFEDRLRRSAARVAQFAEDERARLAVIGNKIEAAKRAADEPETKVKGVNVRPRRLVTVKDEE